MTLLPSNVHAQTQLFFFKLITNIKNHNFSIQSQTNTNIKVGGKIYKNVKDGEECPIRKLSCLKNLQIIILFQTFFLAEN